MGGVVPESAEGDGVKEPPGDEEWCVRARKGPVPIASHLVQGAEEGPRPPGESLPPVGLFEPTVHLE